MPHYRSELGRTCQVPEIGNRNMMKTPTCELEATAAPVKWDPEMGYDNAFLFLFGGLFKHTFQYRYYVASGCRMIDE
jgi:hypothetical protein